MAYRRMTRMISFRVSEDQFERLRAQSQAEGARSVSDYARYVLSREARESIQWGDELQRLKFEVHRLSELLGRSFAPSLQQPPSLSVAAKKPPSNS